MQIGRGKTLASFQLKSTLFEARKMLFKSKNYPPIKQEFGLKGVWPKEEKPKSSHIQPLSCIILSSVQLPHILQFNLKLVNFVFFSFKNFESSSEVTTVTLGALLTDQLFTIYSLFLLLCCGCCCHYFFCFLFEQDSH